MNLNKKELLQRINEDRAEGLSELVEEFSFDMEKNLLFYMFNLFCMAHGDNFAAKSGGKLNIASHFIHVWRQQIKSKYSEEIKEINEIQLGDVGGQINQIMMNGLLPSTEDYSALYDEAANIVVKNYMSNIVWNPDDLDDNNKNDKDDDDDDDEDDEDFFSGGDFNLKP
jgi:hypothetical protein